MTEKQEETQKQQIIEYFVAKQESLEEPFQSILHTNLWDLYQE